MSKSNWYFKRSFVDPKTNEIKLYYLHVLGNSAVLVANTTQEIPEWTDLPEGFPVEDAIERVKTLQKPVPSVSYSFNHTQK